MIYELPGEASFPAEVYARDLVRVASQSRADISAKYQASYEAFWLLGREEIGIVQMQAILDRLGMVGIQILQDAAAYVAGIETAFPGSLPEKYHSAPYDYDLEILQTQGRLVLLGLKAAWQ